MRRPVTAVRMAAVAGTVAVIVLAGAWAPGPAARAAGGSIPSESPSAILAAATSAIDGVSTVRFVGSGVSGSNSISLDLRLAAGKGGEGTVSEDGAAFQFVVIGGEAYFKASTGFWKRFTNEAVAQLIAGRWLKAPATGSLASLANFGNLHALVAALLSPTGVLSKGPLTTVRGQKVVAVTNRADGGTLYVAATGTPYPVEIANAREHGVIVVEDINQPVTLVAPSGAIDLQQLEHAPSLAIPGAPGYSTFTGPLGRPLPVGRPWGKTCQPVRFTVDEHVPQWAYEQIAATIAQARRDGIDVTVENRQFDWTPGSLYYVGGQSPASTVRVAIFADDGRAPLLSNGKPEHINLGWNARADPDGEHEDLTSAQGVLWMKTIDGNAQAVRLSTRYLIAMTQGIIDTSRQDSAIAEGSTIDQFTPTDIAAMKRMSGCGSAAEGAVASGG